MAIRYQISTWRSSTAMEASDYRTVKRIDAALDETWRQIYAMCKADATLDTVRARRLRREFITFQGAAHVLVKDRHYFSKNFVLRSDNAGACEHVKFVAIRSN